MNELAMNFATRGVDHGYLKLLIIGKPISVKAFSEGAAMRDRVGIRFEFDTDPVSERNTVHHVEEKFLHNGQSWFVLFARQ